MVFAQAVPDTVTDPLGGKYTALAQVFGIMINVVLGVGIALTVVYLILGGIKYIMSQGDQKAIQTARESLTYAVIGFVVVIGAFTIRTIVTGLLGASTVDVPSVTP